MSNLDNENEYGFDPIANAWSDPRIQTAILPIEMPEAKELSRSEQLHKLSLMLHQPEKIPCEVPVQTNFSESNQRQFARCPISEERTTGVLSIKGRSFNCRLVELSIGGFGVVVASQPKFAPNAVGSLRAPGLNYVVSVTRQEMRPGGVYIGLKQLEEIVDREHPIGEPSPIVGHLIAGISGVLIAVAAYYFMRGT